MASVRELVLLGGGRRAHLAVFRDRDRMNYLLAPTTSEETVSNCMRSGKGHLANGKAPLCRRCFPGHWGWSAAQWRKENKHG